MSNMKIGIVSGYFNPIHKGHLEYINSAKQQCDYLICIVNNDDQVKLKNSKLFMDEQHRLYIVQNLKSVDKAIVSIDSDLSVAKTLSDIVDSLSAESCEFFFFNSGDRCNSNQNINEVCVCQEKNIHRTFIDLPKVYSSSELKLNLASENIK